MKRTRHLFAILDIHATVESRSCSLLNVGEKKIAYSGHITVVIELLLLLLAGGSVQAG